MERKLASIQRIAEVQPIENADAIEAVRVNGWWVVAKKGEFTVGSWCVYFEIDSWIPDSVAPFLTKEGHLPKEFMGMPGQRLKTIKLRGQISQGLVLPVTQFTKFPMTDEDEGRDVTESLGIQKWELPLPAELRGVARGNFPWFIRKTDEERIQNIPKEIRHAFETREVFEVTLKLDGSSMTVYFKDGEVGVCSRNINLKVPDLSVPEEVESASNTFIRMALDSGLLKALQEYGRHLAVQGELMGPGIQENREGFTEHKFFVFNVWDIDEQRYLNAVERTYVLMELEKRGFTNLHVPVIAERYILTTDNISEILKLSEGPSINNKVGEGWVYKSLVRDFSFKAISNKFLLEKDRK